jgi:hypothetical protein
MPNGVLPWKGGVLVSAAPNLWFLRDSQGKGVADVRRVLLTGFGEGNPQLRFNGLQWGLDNWVYGANGRSGGNVRRPEDAAGNTVPLGRLPAAPLGSGRRCDHTNNSCRSISTRRRQRSARSCCPSFSHASARAARAGK